MKLKTMFNIIAIGIVVFALYAGIMIGFYVVKKNESRALYDSSSELIRLSNEMLNNNDMLIKLMNRFVIDFDESLLFEYFAIADDYNSLDGKLDRMVEIGLEGSELGMVDRLLTFLDELIEIEGSALEAFGNGDLELAASIISGGEYFNKDLELGVHTRALISAITKRCDTEQYDIYVLTTTLLTIFGVMFALSFVAFFILQMNQRRRVLRPVYELAEASLNLAKGNFQLLMPKRTKDEIGWLNENFASMADTIRRLITEIDDVAIKHTRDGLVAERLTEDNYSGSFAEMAGLINQLFDNQHKVKSETFNCIDEIVDGNFDAPLRKFPGLEGRVNEIVDGLRDKLRNLAREISAAAQNASDGNLDYVVEASNYKGRWAELMRALGNILVAVKLPMGEVARAASAMENGDFTERVVGDFKGDFLIIKNTLNSMADAISSYIAEINDVLALIAGGSLRQGISRAYVGQFASIRDSINAITEELNGTISEITQAASQVSEGSERITGSSQEIAAGATSQAESIRQLTDAVNEISTHALDNSTNAQEAAKLADVSKQNAEIGTNDVKQLLLAMEGISASSGKISLIIKTIQEIAFQTNLLALNASIEAAHAGEQGRGFAVVAEEVRNLAAKSDEAAKETSQLIQESIDSVTEGTLRANETAGSLSKIVSNVMDVSEVIGKIYEDSSKQTDAITNLSGGLVTINEVVQSNTATSQESAATAEELSSQADTLRRMIAFFRT